MRIEHLTDSTAHPVEQLVTSLKFRQFIQPRVKCFLDSTNHDFVSNAIYLKVKCSETKHQRKDFVDLFVMM